MNKIIKMISEGILKDDYYNDLPINCKVISDIEIAKVFAFQQFELETVWVDLKSANSLALEYAKDEDEDYWTENASEEIYNQLANSKYHEFINEIESDLFNCFLNSKYNLNDEFWNIIFSLYHKGIMPCGWEGEYPNGKIVVFLPSE